MNYDFLIILKYIIHSTIIVHIIIIQYNIFFLFSYTTNMHHVAARSTPNVNTVVKAPSNSLQGNSHSVGVEVP